MKVVAIANSQRLWRDLGTATVREAATGRPTITVDHTNFHISFPFQGLVGNVDWEHGLIKCASTLWLRCFSLVLAASCFLPHLASAYCKRHALRASAMPELGSVVRWGPVSLGEA